MSKYRSGYEERIAAAFDRRRIHFTYESTTLKYESPPIPAKKRRYTPDFIFETKAGHKIYVEAKGYLKADDRKKMVLVKQDNPDLDIRFLFMVGSRPLISKKRRGTRKDGSPYQSTTYGGWAEKEGFPWAEGSDTTTVGKVLAEWYKE